MARMRLDREGDPMFDDADMPDPAETGPARTTNTYFDSGVDASGLPYQKGITPDGRGITAAGPMPGSTESPREIFDKPEVKPPAPQVSRRAPSPMGGGSLGAASAPSSGGGSGDPASSMTPARPKEPSPVSMQPPAAPMAFTPMQPLAGMESMITPMNESYSAAQVQQRAPQMPEPVAQYQDPSRSAGMFGRAGGLTGGGLGMPDAGSGIDPEMDALLRALM